METYKKIGTQNGYNLWSVVINGSTLWNVSLKTGSDPSGGYYSREYLEDIFPVKFPRK